MCPSRRWLLLLLVSIGVGRSHAQGRDQGGQQQDGSPPIEVQLTDSLTYSPSSLTITQGESIVWVNKSKRTHTVTADPSRAQIPAHAQLPPGAKPFDSNDINPGQQYRHTFDVPGTYRYFCRPHELAGMVGTVVVEPSPGAQQPR